MHTPPLPCVIPDWNTSIAERTVPPTQHHWNSASICTILTILIGKMIGFADFNEFADFIEGSQIFNRSLKIKWRKMEQKSAKNGAKWSKNGAKIGEKWSKNQRNMAVF
jgi:hypothetical protein